MNDKKENKTENQNIELLKVLPVTPHNKALYEADKTFLVSDSLFSRGEVSI